MVSNADRLISPNMGDASKLWPIVTRLNAKNVDLDIQIEPLPPSALLRPQAEALSGAGPQLAANKLEQEAALINDAIMLLCGCEGDFVRFSESFDPSVKADRLRGPDYKFHSGIDLGLRQLMGQIAELSRMVYGVKSYSDFFTGLRYGQVNNALAASFRSLCNDFALVVARIQSEALSDPNFTLYKLWMHAQPRESHFQDAYAVVSELQAGSRKYLVEKVADGGTRKRRQFVSRAMADSGEVFDEQEASTELRGGSVLRVLAEMQNQNSLSQIYPELLKHASKPYIKMLNIWLEQGRIVDPFDEFMIQETPASDHNETHIEPFWNTRYTARTLELPLQLSSPEIYGKLISTGKYLNVIRECAGSEFLPRTTKLPDEIESIEDPRVHNIIVTAHLSASRALYSLINSPKFDLYGWLLLLRNSFFMTEADYLSTFLFSAASELSMSAEKASFQKVRTIFGLVKIHSAADMSLAPATLADQLVLLSTESRYAAEDPSLDIQDRIQLEISVPFPLSLVILPVTLRRYQYIFRNLWLLKLADKALVDAGIDQIKNPIWHHSRKELEPLRKRAQMLRGHMSNFVLALIRHSTLYVGDSQWLELMQRLSHISDIEQATQDHTLFIDNCMRESFLRSPGLVKLQAKLLRLVTAFAHFLKHEDVKEAYSSVNNGSSLKDEQYSPEELQEFLGRNIDAYEQAFHRNLRNFIDMISTNFGNKTYVLQVNLALLLQ